MAEKKRIQESNFAQQKLADADKLIKTITELPKERQSTVAMVMNAFIAGMEAQARVTSRGEPKRSKAIVS